MTLAQRWALARLNRVGLPPLPDGTIGTDDRWSLVGLYREPPIIAPRRGRPWRGQRAESFYIEVLSQFGQHLTYLRPAVGGVITGTTGDAVTRKLSGLVLNPGDWEDVDLNTARFRPAMVIDDAVAEPEGVFLKVTKASHPTERGTYLELQCQDQGFLLQDDAFDSTFNVVRGTGIGTAIASLLDSANVYDRAIVATNPTSTAYLGRPIGASKWDALDRLTTLAGLTSPWFDRSGTARVINLPYVGVTKSGGSFEWGDDSPIIAGSVTEVEDDYQIPNKWIVIGRSDDIVKYAGVYELPASHPLSRKNRGGRVKTKTIELGGIASQDDADARARDQAQLDARVHRTRELQVRADPTIEPWDIRTYSGEDWLMESWSHELKVGASMHIKLRESVTV